ncbi:MAG: hypothetical protein Q8S09_17410 [Hyphomonas sp.]|nr:hypothetical protein [Hyphomonas sp.]
MDRCQPACFDRAEDPGSARKRDAFDLAEMKSRVAVRRAQEIIKNIPAAGDGDMLHRATKRFDCSFQRGPGRIPKDDISLALGARNRPGEHKTAPARRVWGHIMAVPAERNDVGRVESVLKEGPFGIVFQSVWHLSRRISNAVIIADDGITFDTH